MNEYPPVSCMCLTYGRPHVLEEAIHSFLLQDYAGVKELIVLNDFDRQSLQFDHREVNVINVRKRFHTVGEKRNACAALASHDLLFVWDDDDIYLPHRLSFSVEHYNPAKRFFKPTRALVLSNGVLSGPVGNLFHSGACFARSLFDEAHGYRHMGSGQDLDLETAFEKIVGPGKNFDGITPAQVYYIYRWGGTQSFHLSGFGRDKPGGKPGNQKVAEYIERQCRQNKVTLGDVLLRPAWRQDYSDLARHYVAGLQRSNVASNREVAER